MRAATNPGWKAMDQADLCGLWTKHCAEGYLKRNDSIGMNITRDWSHPRHPLKRIFKKGVVPDEKDWDKWFPDVKPGAFGTCAVVAVGDVLLTAKRGRFLLCHTPGGESHRTSTLCFTTQSQSTDGA